MMLSHDYARPGPPPGSTSSRVPVLIVEDEQASRTALSRLLQQSGYANQAVGSAEEALQVIRRSGVPRVALVDFNLPGMNGLDLIEKLSRIDPPVLIVLTTAAGGESLLDRVQAAGVEYLRKPLDFERLLGLLDATKRGN
jgi:CheY-like chemotaxis protein